VVNKEVIGYMVASVDEIQRETGTVRVVRVVPRRRRRNIGTVLLENTFRFLRENNVKTVNTFTETAEGFYRKVGFKEDAEFVRVRKWQS
jgi:N-acetylglutamate synthase-like GNAT family acetyltransferase